MENNFGTRRKRNIDMSRFDQRRNSSVHSLEGYFNQTTDQEELEEAYEEIIEDSEEYEVEEVEFEEEEEEEEENDDELVVAYPLQEDESQAPSVFMIDGKPFVPKPMQRKESFQDTHVRVTTYLEKNVHQIIHMLQKQGQIDTITSFINEV